VTIAGLSQGKPFACRNEKFETEETVSRLCPLVPAELYMIDCHRASPSQFVELALSEKGRFY
jgi:hypothetical protein